ncbi:MAG: hypothetical protein LC791_06485 [Acidobacteria bacterium]|nr:hypothetical protein [Acidobacteriota bacterium]
MALVACRVAQPRGGLAPAAFHARGLDRALAWLARAIGVSSAGAALGIAAGFVANSYEGLERLLVLREYELPIDSLRVINIDAVSRWFYKGMPVDGLQRLLLYQPHHLTGYALALLALWLVARATSVRPRIVALGAGLLLGTGFLYSTFTAIIVGVAVAMLFAVRIAQERAWGTAMWSALAAGAPVAAAVGLSVILGYVNPAHGSLLHFGPNPVAFHEWPFVLLLNFGPLLLVGLAGVLAWRWSHAEAAPAAALAAASLGFYFFADVPDMGGVWVGWRAGHLLLMALGLFTGVALDALWRTRALVRVAGVTALALLATAALPTVAIDVFNAQDVENRESAPLFPWTLILSRAEIEGLDWIRRSTPADALVQVDPRARYAGTWAYIPAFAERRMYAGLPISMIPLRPYELATDNVSFGIFRAPAAKEAWEMAHFLNISYLVVGQPERERYEETTEALTKDPVLFRPVFRNEALTVYEVTPR